MTVRTLDPEEATDQPDVLRAPIQREMYLPSDSGCDDTRSIISSQVIHNSLVSFQPQILCDKITAIQ